MLVMCQHSMSLTGSLSRSPAVGTLPPRLTVAICTRNRARLLERAVRSVLPQVNDGTEVLIVDNGSTDETEILAGRMAAESAKVRLLREEQPGLGAARNAALRQARGGWVIFLDDDAVVETGWLAAYETFTARPPSGRVAVVGGTVVPEFAAALPSWVYPGDHSLNPRPDAARVTTRGGPWGCNIAYRRDVALAAGMFHSHLGRNGTGLGAHEETDLNLRIERAGHEIWWLPQARIRHFLAAERLRLGWRLRSAFEGGVSNAFVRWRNFPPGQWRGPWRALRLLGAPFHAAINFAVAGFIWPFQGGRLAAAALVRAMGIAGFAWGLILPIATGLRSHQQRSLLWRQ